ncbi:hypothetical protein [Nocardia sp. NPDC003979]
MEGHPQGSPGQRRVSRLGENLNVLVLWRLAIPRGQRRASRLGENLNGDW